FFTALGAVVSVFGYFRSYEVMMRWSYNYVSVVSQGVQYDDDNKMFNNIS
ncbi:20386_t:CDS:1, partial [Gigaspora rosea]